MPVLSNQRHELFAQEIAKGKSASDAYVAAGYKANDGNAATLKGNQRISGRVAELLAGAAKRAEVTVADVVKELAKLGFANMQDFIKVSADGDPYLHLGELTREQAAALVEVTVEDFKDGRGDDARDVRRIKFKLADKRAALVDIGKHLGMFIERTEVKVGGSFFDVLRALERNRRADAAVENGVDKQPEQPAAIRNGGVAGNA